MFVLSKWLLNFQGFFFFKEINNSIDSSPNQWPACEINHIPCSPSDWDRVPPQSLWSAIVQVLTCSATHNVTSKCEGEKLAFTVNWKECIWFQNACLRKKVRLNWFYQWEDICRSETHFLQRDNFIYDFLEKEYEGNMKMQAQEEKRASWGFHIAWINQGACF